MRVFPPFKTLTPTLGSSLKLPIALLDGHANVGEAAANANTPTAAMADRFKSRNICLLLLLNDWLPARDHGPALPLVW
jgi:hypothetical protein